ncbi:molybdopterin oxidoreductase family protein [Deinococcus hohokamensis]|uniref:Molybdopterin oxidoreductase family protein n=1 Tax=Deinococcus hohokamensis TaxID=309883 RepID=A0ABV9IC65_9DEIO
MMKQSRDSINDIWGERTPHGPGQPWPVRVDERVSETPEHWVRGTCVLCSNGCALDIGVKAGKIVGVRGLASDATNKGRLGPKGLHGWVANHSEDRLTRPLIRENGQFREASWDEAMDLIVQKSRQIVEEHTAMGIGFYTTGQLFLEEYYTLGVIGKGGLGTPHMDGNTRLCTATAAAALKETFGSDGQPGSYEDLDVTDTILHVGHNIASQQTVLWTRILDRLAGPNPPQIIVIDPRRTFTAEKATVHLAPKVGTNVAVLNGLMHLIIQAGKIDQAFLEAHTVGYDDLKKTVEKYAPEYVEKLSGVPAADLRRAGELLANTQTLVSTVLQGVYQSMQATAAAVQVNNLHLIRGLIGKPGSGILQMNGQPTAQNTRETGADGDLPGFRNWNNPEHIKQLAKLWNVHVNKIPHWSPPTHAMQIWRYAEQGSIKMLWIQATNPAVSMPQLGRIRKILQQEDLFVVVQDAFMTETAKFADVVLPAAIWGEKTGTLTNVSRTVHISCKAIEPPGEARSDLDIFLDYARRMDFRDQDGQPLIKWHDSKSAFEAWKECTRGRPCDYTALTYEKLLAGSGIPWPVNEENPDGTPRLYTDFVFPTAADYAETYGQDLETGASVTAEEYKANDPKGRAMIKPAEHREPHEVPDENYPLWLTTGRQVYHFHTRTKTGRSKELHDAAPDAFVQISPEDAQRYGIEQDDWIMVESRRGLVIERARIGDIEPGLVFIPWHYGYWDDPSRPRAANELTLNEWDPVSKQPHYKYAAVRISKYNARDALPGPGLIGRAVEAVQGLIGQQNTPAPSASKAQGPQPKTTQRVDG